MLLRTTKLEQAIHDFDSVQLENVPTNCESVPDDTMIAPVKIAVIQESAPCIDSDKNCITQKEVCITQSENGIQQDAICIKTAECVADGVVGGVSPETALFTEMYRHVVVRGSNPCVKTQYAVDNTYLLCNGASIYFCNTRLLDDEPVCTELPDTLRKWYEVLPQLTFTSVGNPHKVYSEVKKVYSEDKKVYTAAVKAYSKTEKNCRGSDLHTLYTISAIFSWQPWFVEKSFAYNVARIWYTMQYAGSAGVNDIGVCVHGGVPILKIVSNKGTAYLMPRHTDNNA